MRAFLVLGFCIALVAPAFAGSFEELSEESQAIVTRVGENGDANELCKSKDELRSAIREAAKELLDEDVLEGRPRGHAKDAAKYMTDNCGSL